MDEEKNIEESANTFLKSFFDATYNDNKILFDNMQNIYALISFLYNNFNNNFCLYYKYICTWKYKLYNKWNK